jgi:leucyl/phenylalanyl-tRNA---protein transferase
MAESREGSISWYSPDPRAIIPLDTFNVSRSLRQVERKGIFEIRFNTAFSEVITQCAAREDTWISAEIIDSYRQLFEQGVAHSVESWKEGVLAGGLYGVALGGAFFGESMFSRASDASKIALWALVRRLRENGYLLLDTQFLTPHLATLGACEIPRNEYLRLLRAALLVSTDFISGLERV